MTEENASQPPAERLTVPLHEEVLEPEVRTAETGRIRVHKRVETVPEELTVEASREEVDIQRVPVNRQVDTAPTPWREGDTLVIPVVEEVIVTETRLVVREEVRITRRRITEQVPVRGTVRREVVDIEGVDPQPGTRETAS
jgi:uncharacterized protein (TIGR02271 family)